MSGPKPRLVLEWDHTAYHVLIACNWAGYHPGDVLTRKTVDTILEGAAVRAGRAIVELRQGEPREVTR